jgi:hypothetical protein
VADDILLFVCWRKSEREVRPTNVDVGARGHAQPDIQQSKRQYNKTLSLVKTMFPLATSSGVKISDSILREMEKYFITRHEQYDDSKLKAFLTRLNACDNFENKEWVEKFENDDDLVLLFYTYYIATKECKMPWKKVLYLHNRAHWFHIIQSVYAKYKATTKK